MVREASMKNEKDIPRCPSGWAAPPREDVCGECTEGPKTYIGCLNADRDDAEKEAEGLGKVEDRSDGSEGIINAEEGQGKRYSWGYPSIPNIEDHQKVFELLPAQEALGMALSPAFQLIPEQSTAAIIIHHPEARYFSVGERRVDQLARDV